MGDVKLIKTKNRKVVNLNGYWKKMTSLEETNSKSEFKQSKNISCLMKDKKGGHTWQMHKKQ